MRFGDPVTMQPVRVLRRVLAGVAVALTVAGLVLLGIAASTSNSGCSFDNFSCRSNRLLSGALRCLALALLVGMVWACVHARYKRRAAQRSREHDS